MSQDSSETPNLYMDPNLSFARGNRYPNQFYDVAQQYMPPNMRELLKWCTFYFYNSPLIGSALTKISRYPITDLILEDEHESVRNLWDKILNQELKLKTVLMEINLDYHVYGNAFISTYIPFTRFLICKNCKKATDIRGADWKYGSEFTLKCKHCGSATQADVKDIPYKDRSLFSVVRWNPENIRIKTNEFTGRKVYMYNVPNKIKNAVQRGDKDIIEDMPMVVLEAIKNRKMIRFNNSNFKHIKRPTLSEQDQGWGKPLILHILKDMYYLYTLRRAQEAIAMEHIVPFDIIYPMPGAQQDPYVHMDLGNWKTQIEALIKKHRRDPNFKGVIPVPVGFGRLGGDGKAMLLTPELNMLNQQIVGGMGIPQEFLFGGLNWSGSSVSLRTLENDFIQNRTQLLEVAHWVKDKLRVWLSLPELKTLKFADFRMADDVQRNQQLIGLNAQMKVSDQTMLTELGYNYDQEVKKMIEEAHVQNYLNDLRGKGSAKTQGEAMMINQQYQNKLQQLIADSQEQQESKVQAQPNMDERIQSWAQQLTTMHPDEAQTTLQNLKARTPEVGAQVEQMYIQMSQQQPMGQDVVPAGQEQGIPAQDPSMQPAPEQKPPRRQGGV